MKKYINRKPSLGFVQIKAGRRKKAKTKASKAKNDSSLALQALQAQVSATYKPQLTGQRIQTHTTTIPGKELSNSKLQQHFHSAGRLLGQFSPQRPANFYKQMTFLLYLLLSDPSKHPAILMMGTNANRSHTGFSICQMTRAITLMLPSTLQDR